MELFLTCQIIDTGEAVFLFYSTFWSPAS